MVLIAAAILILAVGASSLISSRFFAEEYAEVLKSKMVVVGETLRSQLDRLLTLGIPLQELVGFEEQCQEILKEFKEVSYAMVVDPTGKILFHNDPAQHNKTLTCPTTLQAIKNGKENIQICLEGKEEYYEILLPILDARGKSMAFVRVGVPVKVISQKTRDLVAYSAGVALISLGAGILLLVFGLSAWVTKPLLKLVAVIGEIRKRGTDFSRRVEIHSRDEIGELATSFNHLIEDLQKTTVSKDYVNNILESMIDSLIVVDSRGAIQTVNRAASILLGYGQEELIGKPIDAILTTSKGKELEIRAGKNGFENQEAYFKTKDGRKVPILFGRSVMKDDEGHLTRMVISGRDITERKRTEEERENIIQQLQKALAEVKQLSGLLPICASCKKIRDDKGYWNQIETYIHEHSEAKFSHGICPDCFKKLYPDFAEIADQTQPDS